MVTINLVYFIMFVLLQQQCLTIMLIVIKDSESSHIYVIYKQLDYTL